MIGKGAFIASKAFAKKHYTSAVKSIKELRGPIGKINSKAYKHVTKNPIKYAVGTTGLVGAGVYSESKTMRPKLKKHFGTLSKSDPRYKIMKEKGWV
tara:strand:+ start:59 stop:349 length:291 start_codon:yes stop_codon:yes gene_type:complete